MAVVVAEDLTMRYRVPVRAGGLAAALASVVRRRYRDVDAVRQVSFEIAPGEVVGFIGPNGAGKTSTLKMLSGLLHPTSGELRVLGFTPGQRKAPFLKQIALIRGSQPVGGSQELTVLDALDYQRLLYDVAPGDYRQTLAELTGLLDLGPLLERQLRALSLGERMRTGLALALLYRPRVLFLDEPTLGLDVTATAVIRRFLAGHAAQTGATILLTSHYMADVESLCRRLILIDHGRVRYDGPLRRTLTYRTNLLFDIALAVAGLLSSLATVLLVFTRTDHLAGWTRPETFVLVGTYELLTGVKAAFLDPNLAWFPSRGIREGTLDTYLLQPAPSLFLASLATAAPLALVQAVLGLGVVGLGVYGHPPSPLGVAAWLLLVLAGAAVTWALGVLLACLAFWAPRLELDVFYNATWQLARYPVGIYRRPLRLLLTYVIPLALIATTPAAALLRGPQPAALLTAAVAAAAATALATTAWRLGLRRYTGATS